MPRERASFTLSSMARRLSPVAARANAPTDRAASSASVSPDEAGAAPEPFPAYRA